MEEEPAPGGREWATVSGTRAAGRGFGGGGGALGPLAAAGRAVSCRGWSSLRRRAGGTGDASGCDPCRRGVLGGELCAGGGDGAAGGPGGAAERCVRRSSRRWVFQLVRKGSATAWSMWTLHCEKEAGGSPGAKGSLAPRDWSHERALSAAGAATRAGVNAVRRPERPATTDA